MFQFTEEATKIFEYSKGDKDAEGKYKIVFADPAALRMKLDISLPNRNQLLDQLINGDKAKAAPSGEDGTYTDEDKAIIRMGAIAYDSMVCGLREVFDLAPFDPATGSGCTNRMAIMVWNEYNTWLEKKDGNTPDTATS